MILVDSMTLAEIQMSARTSVGQENEMMLLNKVGLEVMMSEIQMIAQIMVGPELGMPSLKMVGPEVHKMSETWMQRKLGNISA